MSIEQFVRNQQDAMIKKLHLTEEQIVRITPILSQASQDLRKLHEQGSHLTIQILERQDSDILNILTPEQVKKFDQLRKEQRDRFEKNRKERMERLRKQPPQSGGQHGRKANEDTPAAPQAGEMEEPEEAPRPAINEPAPKT